MNADLANADAKSTAGRPFGLASATGLVIANMIGAGIFTTSGYSLATVGDRRYVMLAWVIGGMIALCGARSYGVLARRLTESGGEYLFLTRLVHPCIGFIAGWVSLLAGFTSAIAFAAKTFETYALPESARPDWYLSGMLSVGSIMLFGGLHAIIVKLSITSQNLVVILKMLMLGVLIALSLGCFPSGWEGMQVAHEPVEFSIYALASTLVWISLSFSGFNAAVYITSEVRNPARNVPRALLTGTFTVTLLYLLLNFIFLYAADPESIRGKEDVAAVAAAAIGGAALETFVRLIVSIAALSSVSAMIIAGPRVYAKMASDGVFPRFFATGLGLANDAEQRGEGDISIAQGKRTLPTAAIWFQAVIAIVVVLVSNLQSLLDYLGLTLSISAAATVACVLWLAPADSLGADGKQQGSVWFNRVVATVYVTATLLLAVLSTIGRPAYLWMFLGTIISGLLAYWLIQLFALKTTGGERADTD